MPIQKTDKPTLLLRCWEVFHRRGYHHTSVRDLAEATGLGKAGLLHHFGSKEGVMQAVIDYALEAFRSYVLAVVHEDLPPAQRLEKLLRRQNRLAKHERRGCFFANLALETGRDGWFNEPIQAMFAEWQAAVAGLLETAYTPEEARQQAYELLLTYEGAVTLYKLSGDEAHLEGYVKRTVAAFTTKLPPQYENHPTVA
jgi:TetR/AcrR family transcriptional repressor of nem operon